jgi:hypothetical protein
MKTILITSLLIIIFITTGCGTKSSENSKNAGSHKIEDSQQLKLKSIKIGQAEDFVILAYASISSIPNSSVNGKVGLLPGNKDQIILDASEVIGGAADIIGSEDETIPFNLLRNAKVDLVTAYNVADNLSPDKDKMGLDVTTIKGKILSPGCYKWNNDLIINNDLILEGLDTDIWIFKIPAHFKVSSGVHISLSGGAKASNVYWQVSGGAILESESLMIGTIIAQQFIEMKNHSKLIGRAFVKNGYVNLDQATIIKP